MPWSSLLYSLQQIPEKQFLLLPLWADDRGRKAVRGEPGMETGEEVCVPTWVIGVRSWGSPTLPNICFYREGKYPQFRYFHIKLWLKQNQSVPPCLARGSLVYLLELDPDSQGLIATINKNKPVTSKCSVVRVLPSSVATSPSKPCLQRLHIDQWIQLGLCETWGN